MVKSKTVYVCQNCGAKESKWVGKCATCGEWNSFVEEVEVSVKGKRAASIIGNSSSRPLRLSEVKTNADERMDTGDGELNRVLGGGIVPGSMILLGGEPGIGKSTLILQFALHNHNGKVLYVSGEESVSQIKMRAQRLGAENDDCLFLSGNSLETVLEHSRALEPKLLIIDSIQTLATESVDAIPGSLSQIRECTNVLLRYSKENTITTILIGHITKDGQLAGPKILEHMVDTVLYFEGDRHASYRILRSVKNRFGSTNEIGVFEMREKGLMEVKNPSQVMLNGRPTDASGTAVVCSVEGTRPILIEIQALVTRTNFGLPRRTSVGIDYNRVNLLMAVLEKRAGLHLGDCDAYVNLAGGMKLGEPAIDLGVVLAIVSSYKNQVIDERTLIFGEVGLSGEVRGVSMAESRVREAEKLGFTSCIMPKANVESLQGKYEIKLIGVANIKEAMNCI